MAVGLNSSVRRQACFPVGRYDCRPSLISRNGPPFNAFDTLRKAMIAPGDGKTVLDGEIVCLDKRGRPQFNDLLFHRGEPCFFAFDLLMSDGKDLRMEKLTDRKHEHSPLAKVGKYNVPNPAPKPSSPSLADA